MKLSFEKLFENIRVKNIILLLLGAAIVSFGIYNIHDISGVTEGGIFGFDLLLEHHFHISPSYTNFVLTAICFFVGWKALGKSFIVYSAVSTGAFSLFYFIWEQTPRARVFSKIAEYPLAASVFGALFVGIGVGISMGAGGAQSGDDALAMAFNHFFGWKVSAVYLVSDLAVLLLSLTYIPPSKILYSLLTVILSGQLIELTVKLFEKNSKT